MVIEVDPEHAVHWMSPADADEQIVMGLGQKFKPVHPNGVDGAMHGVFADGSVRLLQTPLPVDQRRALISIKAGDKAPLD